MENKSDSSVTEIWDNFILSFPEFKMHKMPEAYYFCDNEIEANECAELVIKGIKRATSTSLWWFETYDEPHPKVGDLFIITNWTGKAKAIIQTTKLEIVPFNEITAEYAEIEGEGDKSLEYWQKVHWDYYTREMKIKGQTPTKELLILCEQFKTVWPKRID